MNEFEWRQQMRALRTPEAPPEALWGRIEARLAAAPRRTAHRPWLAAAGFVGISLAAIGLAGWHHGPVGGVPATIARAPWKPSDPRLAGAAIELDAARMELREALRQAPDSAALMHLLSLTHRQEFRLRQLERTAG